MQTRMQKYYEESNQNPPLRSQKNVDLYENISNYEVDDYKVDSNATIIDNNAQNIDVERIKKILDTKYNKEPKRRSIVIEEPTEEVQVDMDETREYDINAILEKARNEIEDEPDEKEDSKELMELINTITMHELDAKPTAEANSEEMDPLDILTDLKGNDNTVVVGGANDSESLNETTPIMSLEEAQIAKQEIQEQEEKKEVDLANTLAFTQSDFDDFNDLKREVKSSRALIYTVIVIVSLVLIVGLVIFLNKFLNIGLF